MCEVNMPHITFMIAVFVIVIKQSAEESVNKLAITVYYPDDCVTKFEIPLKPIPTWNRTFQNRAIVLKQQHHRHHYQHHHPRGFPIRNFGLRF